MTPDLQRFDQPDRVAMLERQVRRLTAELHLQRAITRAVLQEGDLSRETSPDDRFPVSTGEWP